MDVVDFASESPLLSSSSSFKQPSDMTLAPSKKKPNLSWKRRKEELHRLRAETQALETRVMFLKLRRTQDTLMKAGMGLSEEQKQLREDAVSEKQKWQSAQEENTQLKDRLERCYKACHDLQTVLSVAGIKQHNLIVANSFAAKALQAQQRNQSLLQLNSSVLSNLQNRLHERLVELDYFIQGIRKSMAGPDIDEVNVHREGFEGTFASVEFKRNRLMPFDAENTFRVIWNVMHLGVVPDDCTHVTECSEDTLISQGCETQRLSCGGTVDLRVSCVMRRIVVAGGFIVLIESTTEWQARPAQAKAWTHVTRDSGWAVVQPNGRPGTCQLQVAVRLRTEDALENGPTLLTPVVSDVVIPMFGEVLSARHQLVENALLDSARTAEQR
ncbi:hypothetical protein P3T76_010258 [Phytophthora citrophthora]|uniref:START domain-containing protein n=1 Tax=Phytophthora citrophthora TaxID=4793 RepID=A0AAD9GBS6_9STRA|nr:hypothetical protein P3T76_010258 [Phytophthora citrophthora]